MDNRVFSLSDSFNADRGKNSIMLRGKLAELIAMKYGFRKFSAKGSINKERQLPKEAGLANTLIYQWWSGDGCSYSPDMEQCFGAMLYTLQTLVQSEILESDCTFQMDDQVAVDTLSEYLDDAVENASDIERTVKFCHELDAAVSGQGVSEPVRDMCGNIAKMLCQDIPVSSVLAVLPVLFSAFFQSGSESYCEMDVYSSRDVATYQKNRDKFPAEVQRMADSAIRIFKEPSDNRIDFCDDGYVYGSEYAVADDGEVVTVALNKWCDVGPNPLFDDVVAWIDSGLHELILKYCGSQNGGHSIFFCCIRSAHGVTIYNR